MRQFANTDPGVLDRLRIAIARVERAGVGRAPAVLPFGVAAIDAVLPQQGLLAGALHEVMGQEPAGALFAAGILARRAGQVLWVVERGDVFGPGLAGAGLHPDRVLYAEAGKQVLLVMEEGLRQKGLAGVVGEITGRLTLTASRRLQLAAESTGAMAIALRRPKKLIAPEPNAAVTQWRVSALPSGPALSSAPEVPGVGRGRWRLELLRSRGGRMGEWMVEACDAAGYLDLVSPLADRPAAALPHYSRVGGALRHRAA